jgi:hypothetical protein
MKTWRCWFKHQWETKQFGVQAADDRNQFVIAWKQCPRCGASKLIHILV